MATEDLQRELWKKTRELRLYKEADAIINSTNSTAILLKKIARMLFYEFKTNMVFMFIKDSNDNLVLANKNTNKVLNPSFEQTLYTLASNSVYQASSSQIKVKQYHEVLTYFGAKYVLTIPIMNYSDPIGCMLLIRKEPEPFTVFDISLLETTVAQVTNAINQLILHYSVEEKEEHIKSLYQTLYKEVKVKSGIDALTGFYNKREFEDFLDSPESKKTTMIMFDLDFFKSYNDSFGHLEGDSLLRKVGLVVSNYIQDMGKCFRYGGEEFIVALNMPLSQAKEVAENLRQLIANLYYEKESLRLITISLGVAERKKGENTKAFLERLDKTMYESKKQGRNKTTISE